MHAIRLFILLLICAVVIPAPLSAHVLPKGTTVHSHDGLGEHSHDSYTSDPDQPIHSKLAECAAIYDSAVDKGPQFDEFLSKPHKDQLSAHAQKLRDKALVIARKKDQENPEDFIAAVYDKVYQTWVERWYFKDDDMHYHLITENQIWFAYCEKLGKRLNILPQFPDNPE